MHPHTAGAGPEAGVARGTQSGKKPSVPGHLQLQCRADFLAVAHWEQAADHRDGGHNAGVCVCSRVSE